MTTIHVTIDDHAEALGVVATLLNQGYQVSIDMDVVEAVSLIEPNYMSRDEVALHERLWGKDSQAQRNIEREAQRQHRAQLRDARREAKLARETMPERQSVSLMGATFHQYDNQFFINGLEVSESRFNSEFEARMQARHEHLAEVAKARQVSCTACGANADEPCRSASGKPYSGNFAHIDRIRDWHTANYPVPADG